MSLRAAIVVVFAACSHAAPRTDPPPPPPPDRVVAGAPRIPGVTLLGQPELEALGFVVTPHERRDDRPADRGTLLCRGSSCVCLEPLDCGPHGCNTLAVARDLVRVHADDDDHCVAEIGTLCGVSYLISGFMYDGDRRYFDARGTLVGQWHVTDYAAYCDGRASTRVVGWLPDCAEPERDVRSLCAVAHPHPRITNPRDLLLR